MYLCMYLCPSFMPEMLDQFPPNFVQTSTPTRGRFLTQVWHRQPNPLTPGYPKIKNLNRSITGVKTFVPGSAGPRLANLSIYKWAFRCLFVCLSVGMWRAHGNPNPYTDLDEIFYAHPHLSKEDFGACLTPAPSPTWALGAWNRKSWRTHFSDAQQVAN